MPDFFFEDPDERTEGICIYLDGMSKALHGNPDTRKRDQAIREELRNEGYEVIEIPVGDLVDQAKMAKIFFRIGRALLGKARATDIRDRTDWFEAVQQTLSATPTAGGAKQTDDQDTLQDLLDLFDTLWYPLIQSLHTCDGVTVQAGGDLFEDTRVVGQYLAQVTRDGQSLYLLDGRDAHLEAIQTLLQSQGQAFQVVLVDAPNATDQILQALAEVAS
ncbi:MAG: hypothetical protein F6J97_23695 [Leptolyngbya sp. SIO4C1]|nr:hypothetical protein [Leptolyngbya sp. SIO4C1]